MCVCEHQLQPHDPLPGACPAGDVEEAWTATFPDRQIDGYFDPIVQAYDALDLRLIADMEGGH